MKGRKVYRDNTIIYNDLVYLWCYIPKYRIPSNRRGLVTKKSLYMKWYCGVGFYSRYHARHVISELYGSTNTHHIHIISGKRLIREGITHIKNKKWSNYIYINGRLRIVRRWVYPPEFKCDSHRRRHFIVYLVSTAEDQSIKKFNIKYKRYFYGYRQSFPWSYYQKRKNKIFLSILQEVLEAKGYRPEIF